MRKFILLVTFFVAAPISFLFILLVLIVLYPLTSFKGAQSGKTVAYAALPTAQNVLGASISEGDGRAEKIRQFLARYKSPLEPYAQDIVDAADQYGMDHRLIPAIAMQESTLCKFIPENSFNCWGFGIYGKTVTRFADYKEGVYTVTKALATRYKDKGLHSPEEIMSMYTPSSNGSWANGVNITMKQLQ